MSATSRMRQLLAPVLSRHADVTVANGWLVVLPVRHFLRGVWLQNYDEGISVPFWGIRNLWAYVHDPDVDGFMRPADLNRVRTEEEISHDLCKEVEEVTLPLLRSVDSIERLYALTMEQGYPDRTESLFHLELAMGNFDRALALRDKFAPSWFYFDDMFPGKDPPDLAHTRLLCGLLEESDRDGIVQRMQEREARGARAYKVKRFWEPTPCSRPFRSDAR
jgi:hypothetical protein